MKTMQTQLPKIGRKTSHICRTMLGSSPAQPLNNTLIAMGFVWVCCGFGLGYVWGMGYATPSVVEAKQQPNYFAYPLDVVFTLSSLQPQEPWQNETEESWAHFR